MTAPKQIHLAAHFPGVNNTTVWSDPNAGSHIEFSSFVKFAQTAERAKFDFMFLAEGLRLREQGGKIYDLDVVGPVPVGVGGSGQQGDVTGTARPGEGRLRDARETPGTSRRRHVADNAPGVRSALWSFTLV